MNNLLFTFLFYYPRSNFFIYYAQAHRWRRHWKAKKPKPSKENKEEDEVVIKEMKQLHFQRMQLF